MSCRICVFRVDQRPLAENRCTKSFHRRGPRFAYRRDAGALLRYPSQRESFTNDPRSSLHGYPAATARFQPRHHARAAPIASLSTFRSWAKPTAADRAIASSTPSGCPLGLLDVSASFMSLLPCSLLHQTTDMRGPRIASAGSAFGRLSWATLLKSGARWRFWHRLQRRAHQSVSRLVRLRHARTPDGARKWLGAPGKNLARGLYRAYTSVLPYAQFEEGKKSS